MLPGSIQAAIQMCPAAAVGHLYIANMHCCGDVVQLLHVCSDALLMHY